MKRLLFLLAGLLLVSGCAKQPVIANLNPRISDQPAGVFVPGTRVAVKGQDSRKVQEVVIFLNDQPPTRLANISATADLLSARLSAGLRDQGLTIDPSSPVRLKFVINDLLVQVSRQKLLYRAEAQSYVTIDVENHGAVITRVFKRESFNESATRPKLPELEAMLNGQLSDILQMILKDEEIRQLLAKK